jgi:hypothetical protein
MKIELLKLRDELKSVQLIVRLLQDERNNQLSDHMNSHNLSISEEEEIENDREWKKVPNR